MEIRCPGCGTAAQLPSSKEGAKVRCGSCERVYVARDRRQRGASKNYNSLIAGLVVAAVAAMLLIFLAGRDDDAGPTAAAKEPEVAAPEPELDEEGWESAPVQFAAGLHAAAQAGSVDRLVGLLDASRALPTDVTDRAAALRSLAEGLCSGDDRELVADWRPYDGEVYAVRADEVIVHLSAQPYDEDAPPARRTIAWSLIRSGSGFKAFAWERLLSDAEKRALAKEDKGYEVVRYEDGTIAAEREPEPLGHLEDTPAELRTRIDELFATMIDLELGREGTVAQKELVALGRPVIPILLTHLYATPIETNDDSIRASMVVSALREITGRYYGFQPRLGDGALATTEERRTSAIKQWFAWWYRHQDDFTEKKTGKDLLDEYLPGTADDE